MDGVRDDNDVPQEISEIFEKLDRSGLRHAEHVGYAPAADEYPSHVWPSDRSDDVAVFSRLSNRTEALPTGD